MGNNGDGQDGSDVLWWLIGGTVATAVFYHFLSPNAQSVAPYFEVTEPTFSDLNSVAVRFGQLRELWSMGYINSEEVIVQAKKLAEALLHLQEAGKTSEGTVQSLTSRIDQFVKDVSEYQASAA